MTDADLLRRYAEERTDAAFAELVRRYVDLVYGVARRQLGGDEHRAKDVTQAVFLVLSRRASSLGHHPRLAGWFHTTTVLTVRDLQRAERRRARREAEAMFMQPADDQPTVDPTALRPAIDDALQQLNAADREVLLARFFSGRSYAELGAELAVSADAARMRAERALGKLRDRLSRRGITSTSAALAAFCATEGAIAAPSGLAAQAVAIAAASASAGGTAAVGWHVFHLMTTTKLMLAVAGAALVALSTWTIEERRHAAKLHALETELDRRQTQAAAASATWQAQVKELQQQKVAAEQDAAAQRAELARIRQAIAARRAALARGASAAAGASANAESAAGRDVSLEAMRNVGRATPSAAAQTELWASVHGDIDVLSSLLTFEPADRQRLQALIQDLPENLRAQYGTPERLVASVISGTPRPISSVRVLSKTETDPDDAVHRVEVNYASGESRVDEVHFHRAADGWQHVVGHETVERVVGYLTARGSR